MQALNDENNMTHAKIKLRHYLTTILLGLVILRVALLDIWQAQTVSILSLNFNPASLVGVLIVIAGLFSFFISRKPIKERLAIILLIFVFVNSILLFFSWDTLTSFEDIIRILTYTILYWIGYEYFSSMHGIRRIWHAFVPIGIIIALLGISQYFLGAGNFETLAFPNRIQGPFPHPNILGFTATFLTLALAGLVVFYKKSGILKSHPFQNHEYELFKMKTTVFLAAITVVGLFTSLILTYTRGAWLSFFIGAVAFFLLLARKTFTKIVIISILIAIGVASFSVVFSGDSLINQASVFAPIQRVIKTSFIPEDDTVSGRFDLWGWGLEIWQQYPLTGVGLGNYHRAMAFHLRRPLEEGLNPHNDYIRFLVEGGIVGFLLFVALVSVWFERIIRAYKNLQTNEHAKIIALTLLCAGGALFVGALFDNIFRFTGLMWCFWLFSGAILGYFYKKKTAQRM